MHQTRPESESRFQRWWFGLHESLGRCPRLVMRQRLRRNNIPGALPPGFDNERRGFGAKYICQRERRIVVLS